MSDKINRDDWDQRYGGPFDRGAADCYYRRDYDPHYYVGDTYSTPRVECEPGTPEWDAYRAGFRWNMQEGMFKDWGDWE